MAKQNIGGRMGVTRKLQGIEEEAGDLVLDDTVFLRHSVTAGITASTSQSQGNGALTAEINEVAVVGSTDDTVTLPVAAAGRMVLVVNNGANTLQIFPALGDDLGMGLNLSTQLEASETVEYVAYDDTNWEVEATTELIHAEMFDVDNTDVFVVNAADEDHMYHTNGIAALDLAGWTFDIGGGGSPIAIASIADGADSGVDIAVTTSTPHGLAVDDIISQTNLADAAYVGTFVVKAIISTTVYEVAAVFTATGTGTMDQASVLIAGAGAAGAYLLTWAISAAGAGSNEIFDFAVHIGATHQDSTNSRRKFGAGGDVGSMGGTSILDIAAGDKVSFMVTNAGASGNITIRDFTLVLVRL